MIYIYIFILNYNYYGLLNGCVKSVFDMFTSIHK